MTQEQTSNAQTDPVRDKIQALTAALAILSAIDLPDCADKQLADATSIAASALELAHGLHTQLLVLKAVHEQLVAASQNQRIEIARLQALVPHDPEEDQS